MATLNVYSFDQSNVNLCPREPGVYWLFWDGELIYIGMSDWSIRSRLCAHLSGSEGSCTAAADQFAFETTTNPELREQELLEGHRVRYGRYPRCNDRKP